jgi:recombination protein RecA
MAKKLTGTALILQKYGPKAIRRLGEDYTDSTPAVPTGSLLLDLAVGVGGIPRGRITEIFGQEESGKTSVSLGVVRNAQLMGGKALYIDMEQALDRYWAETSGVDTDALYISQPDWGEEALEIVEECLGEFDVIVVDSVSALVPKAEAEGKLGDAHMAQQARMMGQALRRLGPKVRRTGTALIFTNQMRQKIGVVFGSPWTTSGGNALKFYASLRIECRRGEILKAGEEAIGVKIRAYCKKNKVATPYKTAFYTIMFDTGVTHAPDLIELGLLTGLLDKGHGGRYTVLPSSEGKSPWGNISDLKVHGEGKLRSLLLEDFELAQVFESEVRRQYGLPLVQYPIPEVVEEDAEGVEEGESDDNSE